MAREVLQSSRGLPIVDGATRRSHSTAGFENVVMQSTPPLQSTPSLQVPTVSECSSTHDNQLVDTVGRVPEGSSGADVEECDEVADMVRTGGQVCTDQV
ncbi:hypothetical protein V6N13_014781 [Hibiscus sabdariffa]|uniref:Uncharacterized protein n=2 Tax=Hibiscus sabdariffa TaxID=183260 RepID=A0ABR2RWV8_9ROSI